MTSIIKAERLKLRHTFGGVIAICAPIATLLLALLLTGGMNNAMPSGAWNWWYIMLLPGMLSVLCHLSVKKDGKLKFQNMLSLEIDLRKGWIGKILYCSINLLIANAIIFLGATLGGALFGSAISIGGGAAAAILLTVSYIWQVPLYMYLSAKFGLFASIFTSMVMSVGGVVTLADKPNWWMCPSSIPIRLMCPPLGLQPNGLPIPSGSELFNTNVIIPGIILSVLWFVAFTIITTRWFARTEVK